MMRYFTTSQTPVASSDRGDRRLVAASLARLSSARRRRQRAARGRGGEDPARRGGRLVARLPGASTPRTPRATRARRRPTSPPSSTPRASRPACWSRPRAAPTSTRAWLAEQAGRRTAASSSTTWTWCRRATAGRAGRSPREVDDGPDLGPRRDRRQEPRHHPPRRLHRAQARAGDGCSATSSSWRWPTRRPAAPRAPQWLLEAAPRAVRRLAVRAQRGRQQPRRRRPPLLVGDRGRAEAAAVAAHHDPGPRRARLDLQPGERHPSAGREPRQPVPRRRRRCG